MGFINEYFYVVDSKINVLKVPTSKVTLNQDNITSSLVDLSSAEVITLKWEEVEVDRDSLKNGFFIQDDQSFFPGSSLCFFFNDSSSFLALSLDESTFNQTSIYGAFLDTSDILKNGVLFSTQVIRSSFVYNPSNGEVSVLTMVRQPETKKIL